MRCRPDARGTDPGQPADQRLALHRGRGNGLAERQEPGQTVFSVKDTGIGMPPETIAHVFELFAQGDRTIARSEGGLGIGLTVVKHLAELHGGSAEAFSAGPGRGSEFTVRIPSEPHPPEESRPGARGTPVADRPMSFLIVDDNEDTAIALAQLLELMGHKVATAHEGHSAIAAALATRPEIILLDIGLPGLDGYEVARRVRRQGLAGSTIIAITGYGNPEDRKLSREAGFDHHLVKPVDYNVLAALLGLPRI